MEVRWTPGNIFLATLLALGLILTFYSILPHSPRSGAEVAQELDQLEQCQKRGVEQLTAAGYYPTMPSGRAADIVIGQRCRADAKYFDTLLPLRILAG